jgi:hypothetical protein
MKLIPGETRKRWQQFKKNFPSFEKAMGGSKVNFGPTADKFEQLLVERQNCYNEFAKRSQELNLLCAKILGMTTSIQMVAGEMDKSMDFFATMVQGSKDAAMIKEFGEFRKYIKDTTNRTANARKETADELKTELAKAAAAS